MSGQRSRFGKRVRDWLGGAVLGALAAGLTVAAMAAGDPGDLDRVAPFDSQSLWLMKQARAIIETYQVDSAEKPAEESKLLYGAIKGMVEAWGDPYTRYVDPVQLKEEEIEMEGEYGGLGIYIGQRDGRTLVISPIEDTPADRAGLKPQDQIVKVEDEIILGWDSQQVVKRLRGKPGTSVTIWIRREGEEELLKFEIERENIKLVSVRSEMMEDRLGYVKISQFKQNTARDVREAFKALIDQGARGFALDLRNNGGGLLNGAVEICDMFLNGGLVVGMKGRVDRANDEIYANPGTLTSLPMVVLINEGSASASEIVAGALSDRGRALSVGKKTFGKGSVQTLFSLTDGSGLYVTIARYHTPSGKVIDHVGLEPDVEVEGEVTKDKEKDEQLKRALEELQNIISGKTVPLQKLPEAS
ncbi:MAG: PDZ domain-containing protein [Synergistaceae bacterium]|nr:PDZ domain-containing protein [Synergistaceae bacterium]